MPNSTFSVAVKPGKRLKLWKMKLTVSRRSAKRSLRLDAVMSRPPTFTDPDDAVSKAPMMLSVVVLPLPEGPSTTTNSPAST